MKALVKNVVYSISVLLLMTSCISSYERHNEEVRTKTFTITDFRYLHLEGGFKVELVQSETEGLRVKADKTNLDDLEVEVRDSTLNISLKDQHFTLGQIILYIDYKDLKKIYIEGGARLQSRGVMNVKDITMKVEGGAKIDLNIKAEKIKVVGEGGVSVDLEGTSDFLYAEIYGAGHLDGADLKCKIVKVKVEGIATASVYATDSLKAVINGVGKIKYTGDPKIEEDISGLGFVSKD